jgi:hypothetical protein
MEASLSSTRSDDRRSRSQKRSPRRPKRSRDSAPMAGLATTFGPVFIQDQSASGKRDSSAQRQTAQNRLQARNGLRGDRNAAATARQWRAPWPSRGKPQVRKTAWWAREDSNLQPHHYERAALPPSARPDASRAPICAKKAGPAQARGARVEGAGRSPPYELISIAAETRSVGAAMMIAAAHLRNRACAKGMAAL